MLRDCRETNNSALQIWVDTKNGSVVVEFVAVVWGWEYGEHFSVEAELIAILYYLMGANYQLDLIELAEQVHHLWTVQVPCSPTRLPEIL